MRKSESKGAREPFSLIEPKDLIGPCLWSESGEERGPSN